MKSKTPSDRLADRLRQSGSATCDFFGRLRPEDWQYAVYREGGQWSIRAILAHFVSVERAMQQLLQDIQSGKPGAPLDFNIDEFNKREVQNLRLRNPQKLLYDFKAARAASIALTERISTADLQRYGRHPWLGNAPLSDIIKLIYRHNQIHQRDIRRALHTHANPVAHERIP